MKERFDQAAFKMFAETEQLLLKSARKEDITEDLKLLKKNYDGDYDEDAIGAELQLFIQFLMTISQLLSSMLSKSLSHCLEKKDC